MTLDLGELAFFFRLEVDGEILRPGGLDFRFLRVAGEDSLCDIGLAVLCFLRGGGETERDERRLRFALGGGDGDILVLWLLLVSDETLLLLGWEEFRAVV